MSVTRGAVGSALIVVAVLVQLSMLQHVDVLGARPDIAMLVAISLALLSGSVAGAGFGFMTGLLLDLASGQPPGAQALIGTVVGYWCGRWGEVLVSDDHPVPPLVAGVLGTAAMQLLVPLVEYLVGLQSEGIQLASTIVAVTLGGAVAIPIYLLVRSIVLRVPSAQDAELGADA